MQVAERLQLVRAAQRPRIDSSEGALSPALKLRLFGDGDGVPASPRFRREREVTRRWLRFVRAPPHATVPP